MKNKVIIFPLLNPWDWSADYLRQTALLLRDENEVIIYDQNQALFFLKKQHQHYPKIKNIHFVQPKYFFPGRRFPFIEHYNRKFSFFLFLTKYFFRQKIFWCFYPDFYDLAQVSFFRFKKIYDCVDFHRSQFSQQNRLLKLNEKQLIRAVDLFTVNSHSLEKLHRNQVKQVNFLAAQGFFVPQRTIHRFHTPLTTKPLIGFIGALNYRTDFSLLIPLIKNHPDWNFVFIGRMQKNDEIDLKNKTYSNWAKIQSFSNTYFHSAKDRYEVYRWIKTCSLGIIPYSLSYPENRYAYPMKLFEYIYFGKRVVSSAIIELKQKKFKKFVILADTYQEWENAINKILQSPEKEDNIKEGKELALQNSWAKKLIQIEQLMQTKHLL